MKITFILPQAGMAGGIRVIAIYAKRLMDRGHKVFVVSQPLPHPSWRDHMRSLVTHRRLKAMPEVPPSYFDDLAIPHRILERTRPVTDNDVPDADVIVATWWETAEWVAQLSSKKGAKAYFIQHHEIFDYLPIERVKATWSLPMHKITISQWLVDLAREEYGDNNVSRVPNSVDTDQFHAPPRGRQPMPTVGLLYSEASWKGCDIGLAAFTRAAEKISKLLLISFGCSPPIKSLPLPNGTKFYLCPAQHKLRDLYAECDAWLFCSRSEGFGLPILEAMACRTPVIATPAGAAPELLNTGGGLLVHREDPQDMSQAIIQICQMSDEQWRKSSDEAYAKALSYTWDNATDQFLAALTLAIERSRRGDLAHKLTSLY